MDKKYMLLALKEAKKCYKNDDVPVGCVIVKNNKIISQGHNQKEKKHIATKHAEIIAIEKACKKLNTWHLDGCVLYTTLEPCIMCVGAIIQSRIKKIVYATESKKFGYVESLGNINEKFNHKFEIVKNICKDESEKMLVDFFKKKR